MTGPLQPSELMAKAERACASAQLIEPDAARALVEQAAEFVAAMWQLLTPSAGPNS
jgi:hypothetical protein